MEAILLCGIQATGKSTFCRERFFASHVRLNLDMLKTRHREEMLLRACIEACIEAKQAFVVDHTNPLHAERERGAIGSCEMRGAPAGVAARLDGMPVSEKVALLAHRDVVFEELPGWERRGSGVIWEEFEKESVNPQTGATVTATRRRLRTICDLLVGEYYGEFIRRLLR